MSQVKYTEQDGTAILKTTNESEWIGSDRIVLLSEWA